MTVILLVRRAYGSVAVITGTRRVIRAMMLSWNRGPAPSPPPSRGAAGPAGKTRAPAGRVFFFSALCAARRASPCQHAHAGQAGCALAHTRFGR